MEFFRIQKDIPFMRHALVFNVISLITFLLSVFFLFYNGLHLSVEFSGGTLIGLGRSIFSILEKNQVEHAQGVIVQRLAAHKTAIANFITTLRGGQLLRVQMVPVLTTPLSTRVASR